MIAKCKNPYYDNKIDKKFVFLLAAALNGIDILIGCKDVGLYKKDNLIGILNTEDDYLASDIMELSVYEVFSECIPDGMRYNKELDKLVPDVVSDESLYHSGIKVEFEKVADYTKENHRDYNVGSSNYAAMKIQPWDVWRAWSLNPWDADIVKRIARTKNIPGMSIQEARMEDYEKIIHNCKERISQLKKEINVK